MYAYRSAWQVRGTWHSIAAFISHLSDFGRCTKCPAPSSSRHSWPGISKCRAKTHTPPLRRLDNFKRHPRLLTCTVTEVQYKFDAFVVMHRGSIEKAQPRGSMPWKVAQMMVIEEARALNLSLGVLAAPVSSSFIHPKLGSNAIELLPDFTLLPRVP